MFFKTASIRPPLAEAPSLRRPHSAEASLPDLLEAGGVLACAIPIAGLAELSADRIRAFEAALPEAARNRLSRFTNAQNRLQSMAARLLALEVLRMRLGNERFAWLETPPYGPSADCAENGAVHITLAHTPGMVACAFSRSPAGLDLERMRSITRMQAIAARHAPVIIEPMRRASSHENARLLFFRAWGLKECAVKMSRSGRAFALSPSLHAGDPVLLNLQTGDALAGTFLMMPKNSAAPEGALLTVVPTMPDAPVLIETFAEDFFERAAPADFRRV